MKKLFFGKAVAVILAVLLLGACSKIGAVEIGQDAPDFSISDLSGKMANLSDYKGKVVILNFFASWCPPCRGEIPDFIDLQNTYRSRGLEIIGVNDEEPNVINTFVKSQGINYIVLSDREGRANDAYGPIRAIPTTFVIGKDFKIKKQYIGARPKDVFENDIKELLQ